MRLLLFLIPLITAPARGGDISGPVRVVDGDTLYVNNVGVGMFGGEYVAPWRWRNGER